MRVKGAHEAHPEAPRTLYLGLGVFMSVGLTMLAGVGLYQLVFGWILG